MSERTIQDEIEIIEMCLPVRDYQGGLWFGHNNNFADATFVDYGACRAFAAAARALPTLVKALEEIVSPIKFIQERAKASGDEVNGAVAVKLADNAEYLRQIAVRALAQVTRQDGICSRRFPGELAALQSEGGSMSYTRCQRNTCSSSKG